MPNGAHPNIFFKRDPRALKNLEIPLKVGVLSVVDLASVVEVVDSNFFLDETFINVKLV
jgi:hypothetical protein